MPSGACTEHCQDPWGTLHPVADVVPAVCALVAARLAALLGRGGGRAGWRALGQRHARARVATGVPCDGALRAAAAASGSDLVDAGSETVITAAASARHQGD